VAHRVNRSQTGEVEIHPDLDARPAAVISLSGRARKTANTQVNFSKGLNRFSRRKTPRFRVHRDDESNETIISGMASCHLEIYVERMKREYGCEVVVGQSLRSLTVRPSPSRRSSITTTKNKRVVRGQFAKVQGMMEPSRTTKARTTCSKRNRGRFDSREYVAGVDKGFQEQLKKGMLIGASGGEREVCRHDGAYHAIDSWNWRSASRRWPRSANRTSRGPIIPRPS